jgi:hypothetical protein
MELTVDVLGHECADQLLVALPTMDPRMKATTRWPWARHHS